MRCNACTTGNKQFVDFRKQQSLIVGHVSFRRELLLYVGPSESPYILHSIANTIVFCLTSSAIAMATLVTWSSDKNAKNRLNFCKVVWIFYLDLCSVKGKKELGSLVTIRQPFMVFGKKVKDVLLFICIFSLVFTFWMVVAIIPRHCLQWILVCFN